MCFCVQNTKHKQEIMCKNFLQEVSEVQNPNESSSDELQLPEKQSTPRGPKQDSPSRLSGDVSKHKLDKTVAGGEVKQYHARQCKCALHIREVKQDAFVNSALFRFTKGLGWRNTTQLGTARLSACSFFSHGFSSFICTFTF